MGLVNNMAETVRSKLRSFLKIDQAQPNAITIQESFDYEGNAAKNRIWYRGDGYELSQLYKSMIGDTDKTRFWAAVPTKGREIRKIHTGIPSIIIDILVSIVVADMNDIQLDESKQKLWEEIAKDNNFSDLVSDALTDALVVGDGAFKLSIDTNISQYPIMEFISGEDIDIVYDRGRIREVIFKTVYHVAYHRYVLEETYGYGYILSKLYEGDKELPLNAIKQTESLAAEVTFDNSFMMAVPFKVFKSNKWKGRGRSVLDSKTDNFDSLDEAWSQ